MSISSTRRFSNKLFSIKLFSNRNVFEQVDPPNPIHFWSVLMCKLFFFLLQNIFTQSKNVFTISRKQSSFSCLVFYDRTIFWKYFNIEFNNAWWLKEFLLTLSHFLCKVSTCLKLESLKIEGKKFH